jgi:hypothetical protein
MFFRMDFDARGTEGKKTFLIFAEVEDEFLWMEGAVARLVL